MATTKSRKASHKCATRYCRNNRAPEKRFCHKCRMRTWRARNPVAAAYNSLVHHARARKIQVTITRPEFVAWAMEVGLFDAKLRRNTDLHVDRRDAVRGYSLSNIQVLRYDENIAKGNRERHYPDYKAQRWAMLEAPCGCEVEEPF